MAAPAHGPRLEADFAIGAAGRVRLWAHDALTQSDEKRRGAHGPVELCWVEEGELLYEIGSCRFTVRAGETFIVPSGVEHRTTFLGKVRSGGLWLDAAWASQIAEAVGKTGEILVPGPAQCADAVVPLARVVREEVRTPRRGNLLVSAALAEAMTVAALRAAPTHKTHPTARDLRILRAVEQIEQTYAEPLTVEQLARTAGMSRFRFMRLFGREVGVAPYRYLQGVRLTRAAEVLSARRASVTEAALAVGFRDMSRFGRAFRQRFGVAPSEYAKNARSGRFLTRPGDGEPAFAKA